MKRKFAITLLIAMIVTETIILSKQNIDISQKNNGLLKELEENKLIVSNEISLNGVIEEKNIVKEKTQLVFKDEDIESKFKKEEEKGESLNKTILELENNIVALESQVSTLQNEYNKLLKEYEIANSFYITGVPFINQYPDYPTGCESVALTILLNYYGVLVTPDDIINTLKKGSLPYNKNGVIYGGNPEIEFIGSPYSLNSFGVYEQPIAEVANKFKEGITIATGTEFDDILKIVGTGTPVIVWTSMGLAAPYISTSWTYEPTGEKIYWRANEHAVVLIGYTPDKVIISDPIGGQMKYQSLSIFRERYNYYGKKALYY